MKLSLFSRVKAAIQKCERENASVQAPLQRSLFLVGKSISKAEEFRIINRHAMWAESMSRSGHDGPFAA